MRTRTLSLLATASLAVAATPTVAPSVTVADAHGAEECDGYFLVPPEELEEGEENICFSESLWWFTASGATGVGNVDHEDLAGEGSSFMSWDDSEPTLPLGGATYATLYSGLQGTVGTERDGDRGQFTAEGQLTGRLDTLTLDLYFANAFGTAPLRNIFSACASTFALDLYIDGRRVLDMPIVSENYASVHVEPVNDVVLRARLKFVGIHEYLDARSTETKDRVGEVDTVHDVRIGVHTFPACSETLWLYDGTEAPATLLVNRHAEDASVADHTTIDVNDPPA